MNFRTWSDNLTSMDIAVLVGLAVYIGSIVVWSAKAFKRGVRTRTIALVWAIAVTPGSISAIITALIRGENDILFDVIMALLPVMMYYVLLVRINYEKERKKETEERKRNRKI